MKFENLTNDELLSEIKRAVKHESQATLAVLDYLRAVEARQLFALRGYPSLFEFCIHELRYSRAGAFRRIAAMRTMYEVPETREKLIEGAVSLSTLSQLYSFAKAEEKIEQRKLDPEEKRALLKKIENKSQNECEKLFVQLRPEHIARKESMRPVGNNLTEIKFMASDELVENLATLRNLLSHQNIDGQAELILELTRIALKKLAPQAQTKPEPQAQTKPEPQAQTKPKLKAETKSKLKAETKSKPRAEAEPANSSSAAELQSARSRYIAQALQNKIWIRDQSCCQFVDPVSKRKCESRHRLEIDHIIPFARGGLTVESNLRLLCRTHNQLAATEHFSKRHMSKFIRF